MYKSDKVALAVCGLGAASIFGAVIWSACEEEPGDASAEAQPYVSPGAAYAHNTHVPNAGWFHATTRTFEPYPYNHYEAGRGHYYGGGWHPEAASGFVAPSATPTPESAAKANTAISRANASSSSSKGSYSRSSGSGSSSSRGGFGSSGGGGGS